MSIYGWGLVSEVMNPPGPRWYRWDQPGSATYWYRPDHAIVAFHAGRRARHGIVPDIASAIMLARSKGVGGPSGISPTSTAASKRPPETVRSVKAKSARVRRTPKGVSARGKCPEGHYWSYKKKTCVKSKFR